MVSMLMFSAAEALETLPAVSVDVTVMAWLPLPKEAALKLQLPPVAMAVPSTVAPSYRVTVLPLSAVPVKVGELTLVMPSLPEAPLSLPGASVGAPGVAGAAVSSTYAWLVATPSLPAVSATLTSRVLLAVSVWPDSDQVFWPTVVLAMAQVAPLSSETSTRSPAARLADSVPLTVCAATLVMRSVDEAPLSLEKATLATPVAGALVSST